jgi:hypothetical protein
MSETTPEPTPTEPNPDEPTPTEPHDEDTERLAEEHGES